MPARALRAGFRALGRAEEALAMLCLVGIAAVINLQVVSRYVMDDPFIWPEEVSRLLMVWSAWWGVAAVTRRGLHIRFDTLLEFVPRAAARALETGVDLLCAALFAFLAWQAWLLVDVTAGLEMAATELPTSLLVWPVLFGAALATLHALLRALGRFLPAGIAA